MLNKIALFTDGIFPFQVGGMQMHSMYLIRYLSRAGIEVHVFHPHWEKFNEETPFSEEEMLNIHFHFVATPEVKKFPGHYLWESWVYSKGIEEARIQSGQEFDLIYVQGFSGWSTLNKNLAAKSLVNLHGLEMFQKPVGMKGWAISKMLSLPANHAIRHANYVQSLGGHLNRILENQGVPAQKILSLPIGIEESWLAKTEEIHPSTAKRKLVFVGRYERRKGIEELMPVLEELLEKELEFEFEFIGPIPEKLQLPHKRVCYHGMIRQPQKIREILLGADVLVVPSHSEGMPTVIMEAMSTACAIIATDVGAVGVQVDESNGWLIPPFDKKALKNAMEASITWESPKLDELRQASLERVKTLFLWPKVIDQMLHSITEKVLA
ncbi:MAG: glycosyltransferase family 4 protein [Bacteroidota bacterium]